MIAVPNAENGKFNGLYQLKSNGELEKYIQIENKYRPTRLYKLEN